MSDEEFENKLNDLVGLLRTFRRFKDREIKRKYRSIIRAAIQELLKG